MPLISRILLHASIFGSATAVLALKDPMAISCCCVDLIPPPQAYQSSSRNVFEVVEICGEEEHCEDEDEDTGE